MCCRNLQVAETDGSGIIADQGRSIGWRLTHSSSFRLMLIYASLFATSVLVLFVIIGLTTDGFMTRELDGIAANELAEIQADAGGTRMDLLQPVVDGLVRHAPGFFYLLQDDSRHVLAGNMTAIEPVAGKRSLPSRHGILRPTGDSSIRGQGLLLPDAGYLFVGSSARARDEMRHSLLDAFFWSIGAIVALGLGGGLFLSMLVLKRIEAISLATRAIMAGKLSQRIAITGSGDELDHLSGSLNAMLERIEALVAGLEQISNDIAHDLRTPLTRLRQRLELAQGRAGSPEEMQEQVRAATSDVDTILDTFTSLLRIAQIEAHAGEAGFAKVELKPLIEALLDAYAPVAEQKQQVISADIQADVSVFGDRTLLGQLLANLIENALRHTPAGSRLAITAGHSTSGVRLAVSDDGPGIPQDQTAYVIRRFARLDASRSTPGTGLGLSLVKAIAGLHHATLHLVDNRPGLSCVLIFSQAR